MPLFLLLPVVGSSQTDTLSVFFNTDIYSLSKRNTVKIDSLLSHCDRSLVKRIDIIGLADHRGTAMYNLRLSELRAGSVAAYIQDHFDEIADKIEQKALGEDESATNLQSYRRVDIVLTKIIPQVRMSSEYTPSTIPIKDLSVGNVLKIKGLNFHPGRSVLLPKSIPHLKDLEKLLVQHPNLEIEIQGHVCCPDQQKNGEDGYNLDTREKNLSLSRAKNIYNYLIRKGISSGRLQFDGFGASRPTIYPEESESDRVKNRRVELLITKL